MATEPATHDWFPKPPVRPPERISFRRVLFGTVLPVAALVAGAFYVFTKSAKTHVRGAAGAAACTGRPAAECGTGSFGAGAAASPAQTARQAFEECVRNAIGPGGGGRGGGGRGGRPSPQEREQEQRAFEVCQSLAAGGGSSSGVLPTTTTAPTAPSV